VSSMVNRCRCCGNDIGFDSFCGICGMTPVSITDSTADLDLPAKEYVRKTLGDGKVEVLCYTYTVDGGQLSEPKESYSTLCQLSSYWVGDVVYCDSSFEQIPTAEKFEVHLRVNLRGKNDERTVFVVPEQSTERSKLGIEFLPCLKARLVIADTEGMSYSNPFSLV